MKNRIFTALAFAGLMGMAACGPQDETRVDDMTIEAPAAAPTMEPAPTTTTDPMMAPMHDDTLMMHDTMPGATTVPPAGTPQTTTPRTP
ncbi:hypothetical protein BH24GEM3_BH24GEM3_09250 [soil metagenome]|nr:hypothetical protein [Gemmatimonadota bacterium]